MNLLKKITCCFFIIVMITGCTDDYPAATTPLESAREFIDGTLKGDFKKAAAYMVNDKENNDDILKIKRDYDFKSPDQKHAYASASIIINEDDALSDSVHIVNYKNSYDMVARKVKVVNRGKNWLVDFKYTFNNNL